MKKLRYMKHVCIWISGATLLAAVLRLHRGDQEKRIIAFTHTFKQVEQLWWNCRCRVKPSRAGPDDVTEELRCFGEILHIGKEKILPTCLSDLTDGIKHKTFLFDKMKDKVQNDYVCLLCLRLMDLSIFHSVLVLIWRLKASLAAHVSSDHHDFTAL